MGGLPTEDKTLPEKIKVDKINDEEEKAKSDEQSKHGDPESTKLNEELTNLAKLAKEKDSSKSEAITKIVDLTNKIKNALEKLQTLDTQEKFAEYKREMKILKALEEYIRDTAVPESNPDAGENNADLTDNAEIEKVKLQKDINALKNLKQALTPIEEKDNDVTEFKELLNLLQTIGNFEEEGTTEDEQKKEIVEQAQKKIVDLKYKYTEIPNLDPDKSFEEATKIEEETVEKKNLIQDIENELNEAQETIKKMMEKLNEEATGNIEEFAKALGELEIKFKKDLGKLKTPITNSINEKSAENLNTAEKFTAVSTQMKNVKDIAKTNFDTAQKKVFRSLGEDGIKARHERYVQANKKNTQNLKADKNALTVNLKTTIHDYKTKVADLDGEVETLNTTNTRLNREKEEYKQKLEDTEAELNDNAASYKAIIGGTIGGIIGLQLAGYLIYQFCYKKTELTTGPDNV